MDYKELISKVRRIEIKAKKISEQSLSGKYQSRFKGRGMTFSEVRNYQIGDDIRNIDWNVTARHGSPYVKIFEEEREQTVILLIDMSGSNLWGTGNMLKKDFIVELAATLAFSAIDNKDKVGALLFTDKIEKFIVPRGGKKHILSIVNDLLSFQVENVKTDIKLPLEFLLKALKKKATIFLISDFIVDKNDYKQTISMVSKKHDLVSLHIFDKKEYELPDMGLVRLLDCETNYMSWFDTSNKYVKNMYENNMRNGVNDIMRIFKLYGVDSLSLEVGSDYIGALINLFNKRTKL